MGARRSAGSPRQCGRSPARAAARVGEIVGDVPIHTGHGRPWVAAGGARQRPLAQFPPDAPDVNPDEGLWPHWKHVEMRHRCGLHRAPLRTARGLAIRRWRRKPHVRTAGCAEAGLAVEPYGLRTTLCNLSIDSLCYRVPSNQTIPHHGGKAMPTSRDQSACNTKSDPFWS